MERKSAKHIGNKIKNIAAVCLMIIAFGGFTAGTIYGAQRIKLAERIESIEYFSVSGSAKNVILMIGDGMGQNHLEVTKAYYGLGSLYMESLAETRGIVSTFSRSSEITDSAAAATALSCGVKTDNGCVATVGGDDVENMSEFAAEYGKKIGIIVTETLTGATPAGFSAHSISRNFTDAIALSEFKSDVDIFMGAGKDYYDGKTDLLEEYGFDYCSAFPELDSSSERIFASFDGVSPYGTEHSDSAPDLKSMSLFAVDYLDATCGENGFFMMIEASHIDKKSHSNDLDAMVAELKAFDETVKAVTEWAAADGETSVIVTADHETGGLQYSGESGDELTDDLFTRSGHSAADVYYFAYCAVPPELMDGRHLDNTNIAYIIRNIIENYAAETLLQNAA